MNRWLFVGFLGLGVACGGEEEPNDEIRTFAQIQQKIFAVSCAQRSCHSVEVKAGNLVLTAEMAHTQLVGVDPDNADARTAGWKRVVANDVANSFLVTKIKSPLDAKYGLVMPQGTMGLDATKTKALEDWINRGAPND